MTTPETVTRALRLYKRKREGIFAQLQQIKDYTLAESVQAGATNVFLASCGNLENIRQQFDAVQNEILETNLDAITQDQLPVQSVSKAFYELYYTIRSVESSVQRVADLALNTSSTSTVEVKPQIKLPKLEVPVWSGDPETFSNFFALFNAAVHSSSYSGAVKLTYLRSLLAGTPRKLIENLNITDADYDIAYKTLCENYNNVRIRATHHLNKMFAFTPLANEGINELQSFLDVFSTNRQAFLNLGIDDPHDFIMFSLAFRCLPTNMRGSFERSLGNRDVIPTFEELKLFVQDQVRIKEIMAQTSVKTPKVSSSVKPAYQPLTPKSSGVQTLLVSPSSSPSNSNEPSRSHPSSSKCAHCSSDVHRIYACPTYAGLDHADKRAWLIEKRRCFKCLGTHSSTQCKSRGRCNTCKSSAHHSSLHFGTSESIMSPIPLPSASAAASEVQPQSSVSSLLTGITQERPVVVLATIQALIRDRHHQWVPIRCILDPGSEINMITGDCNQRLGLPVTPFQQELCGAMQQPVGRSGGVISCALTSRLSPNIHISTEAALVSHICYDQPKVALSQEVYNQFSHLELADRSFHEPGKIDFLIGAEIINEVLQGGGEVIHGNPAAIKTIFGWAIVGRVPVPSPSSRLCLLTGSMTLEESVQRFWQAEEVSTEVPADPLHQVAETHFRSTLSRLPSGTYCVSLPFKDPSALPPLGQSRDIALKRWYNLEAKLRRQEPLRVAYHAFLQEYLLLGHMRPAPDTGLCYIPHFAIERNSTTSPVRVVFDASCRDTSGLSLNDRLLPGPPLQKDIGDVLTLFRLQPVALTTDIRMMYRQIRVVEADCRYQHILWRPDEKQPVQEFQLQTVTYGTSCAPFLAQRVLLQLVEDHGAEYPLAAQVLQESTYMDDCCGSVATVELATQLKQELIELLHHGGFELRKWASNDSQILVDIPREHQASSLQLRPDRTPSLHILGLFWDPTLDVFSYNISASHEASSKRAILSQIASVFDPLGWLSPVIFWAKVFLRELWCEKFDWDTDLPYQFSTRWAAFARQLPLLSSLQLPRLCTLPDSTSHQLIGFSDASSLGYAAAVYLRSTSIHGQITVKLLKAKTKVAPLQVQTIPRLELCGALLLARLLSSLGLLRERLGIEEIYLFTDATTVLSWLHTSPHLLKTFVANRVVEVLNHTHLSQWRYIPSHLNAADCASRGLEPASLLQFSLWWSGPPFLLTEEVEWPSHQASLPPLNGLEEFKPRNDPITTLVTTSNNSQGQLVLELIRHTSSFSRVRRVLAWILRFQHNARPGVTRISGTLKVSELMRASQLCVQYTQAHYYAAELNALAKGRIVSKTLQPLTPFVDGDGLLRVGGRLGRSLLPTRSKHPLLLHKDAPLSKLLCRHYHQWQFHGGPRAVQTAIQRTYWIPGLRSLLRRCIHQCVDCTRLRLAVSHPRMADLPEVRTVPCRPFSKTAVDMAGPLMVKTSSLRNARLVKAYMAMFVCMATKACHIELVGNLTTASYQGALERFMARRGLCTEIYCDNGLNFVGAAEERRSIQHFLQNSEPELADALSGREVSYHFNPPEAPWMGGLWEAAIKSAKRHLQHVTKNRSLTFEEMTTLLAMIEAVLNSRPLCAVPSDPEGALTYLSPGHFLIGEPLLTNPQPSLLDVPSSHLSRWQHVRRASQEFWAKWKSEYLQTLISRQRWTQEREPLAVGDVVVMIRSQVPPLEWPIARVEDLVHGADGIARSARVRTATSTYLRPVAKLAKLLPSDS